MIMEQAASQATLDKYSGDFKEMAAVYAPRGCWHICAQADIRCRSEYWPQLKRRMELFHQNNAQASVYEPGRPWNAVIRESVGPAAGTFWEQQLMGPARLFLIENGSKRPWSPAEFGATVETPPPSREQNDQGNGKPNAKGKGKSAAEKKAARVKSKELKRKGGGGKGDKSQSTTGDGKVQLCFSWNRNAKGCVDGPCPNGRTHLCEKCGGQHRACNCSAPVTDKKST